LIGNAGQTGPGLLGLDGTINGEEMEPLVSESGDGVRNRWQEGDVMESPRLVVSEEGRLELEEDGQLFEHEARQTMEPNEEMAPGGVMTITNWMTMTQEEREEGRFWIKDINEDVAEEEQGWFYYAIPIMPGQATSLLLDGIEVVDIRDEGVEYIIRVEAEFVTRTQMSEAWYQMSTEMEEVFANELEEIEITIPELQTAAVGETWTDTTEVDWCVLVDASSETGGVGNALIITRQVHGPVSIMISPNQFVPFENSTLRTNMTNWYNGTMVSSTLRNIGLNYTFPNPQNVLQNLTLAQRGVTLGAGIETQTAQGTEGPWITEVTQNLDRAMTLPLNNTTNTGEVFALSLSEANRYLPPQTGTGCNTRQAQSHDTSTNASWWLRSPGNGDGLVRFIATNGTHNGASSATTDQGFRPALWIRP